MSALFSGDRLPRLRIDRERIPIPGGCNVRTEIITVMNEGGGILKGTVIADVPWIIIPNLKIETPFVLPIKVVISPEKIQTGEPVKGRVTLVTNGGSAEVIVEYTPHPEPKPVLTLDERQLQFCNLRKGEDITTDLMVRNSGSGVLCGTAESESDWIEVKNRTIWTRSIQVVQIVIHTARAPGVHQPVGRIRIRSSGGNQEVTVLTHFRTGAGPKLRFNPLRIRCIWDKRGIIEETVTIYNDGEGILRGTIPSPVTWLKIIPSIFPVEKSTRIRLSIDTRNLPVDGTLSIQVPIITNAGRDTLIVEVIAGRRAPEAAPLRRPRTSTRTIYRNRLMVYGRNGKTYSLISSGRSGGEGEIYYLTGEENRCAKIFHPHRRTSETEEKLRVMVRNPPPADLIRTLTWPEELLSDLPGGGRVIGYLMPRIPDTTFRSAHLWYDEAVPDERREDFSRIIPALALARVVAGIHQSGHSIGDLRENNILVSNSGDLIIIDTDSFQIRDPVSGRVFWSRVGTGEYLPPEHLGGSFTQEGCDRRYGDHFALAVLIFRFLMDGVHPFQAKGPLVREAPATTDKILLGYFAFESRVSGISPPDYAPPYTRIPVPVKTLFREAFVTGNTRPKARPDATQWVRVLSSLIPQREQSVSMPSLETRYQEVKEKKADILTDSTGDEITPVRYLYRISGGTLYATKKRGVTVFLSDTRPSQPGSPAHLPNYPVPPSIILPGHPVFQGEGIHVGWVISGLERDQYLPWHVITDPESRRRSGRISFSFRHRVACSRNLMAALISAHRLNLPFPSLTERSVYIGPDASVRVLCIPEFRPDVQEGNSPSSLYCSPALLIFRMLMDGYHPFHATGQGVNGLRSPEKRMIAGMYPWSGSDPDLVPPRSAPSIEILPEEIRGLCETEFGENHQKTPGDQAKELSRWFEVLDRVLNGLICCTTNPDHWYLPGLSGCPWCRQTGMKQIIPVREDLLLLTVPKKIILQLSSTRIAGYLIMPRRYRRRNKSAFPVHTRWGVIPLPAERVCRVLLPPGRVMTCLPLTERDPILLVVWKRCWLCCIEPGTGGIPAPDMGWVNKAAEIREINPEEEELKPPDQYLSLIDEMILISTMDRLRGEGIGLKKNRKSKGEGQIESRRRPIQIMLYPIYLSWPDDVVTDVCLEKKTTAIKKPTKKKGQGKGIRGRLQTFLRDFIREDI